MKHILTALLCCTSAFTATAQYSKNILGVHLLAEKEADAAFRAGTGISYEHRFTRRSGIETGLYLRTYVQEIRFIGIGSTARADIRESHIQLPVLYKFWSDVVNFGIGGTIDFYTGWKQTKSEGGAAITSFDFTPNANLGLALRLSKSIKLSKQWLLEPELRYNGIPSLSRVFAGGGIGIKYTGL